MNVAIITAAGIGRRLPGSIKKQFIQLAGRPLLFWTIDPFITHADIDQIIITLPQDDLEQFRAEIAKEFHSDRIHCIAGGLERQDSVYLALQDCPANADFVLVHDGVRPFISKQDISNLITEVKDKKAVIPVSPVTHTLKSIKEGKVIETIPRENVYQVFTPQAFDFSMLINCYRKVENTQKIFTDDASILEFLGIPVYTVQMSPWNIKITTPADIRIAELIISKGEKE
ncbi:MAG TPA: 2-C-methyl-D-erythritol 4-phosphate cytidylyltransferase [Candidatus Cloacimonadota bacterium]|nr:2-C-methyl-D-erythritol 4-phosphate cytidylyltransferase [Candidatus Cloacimonadota bacterium]HPT73071.1 2-C-methyl-D-erythritol 4-phosphate cytidylyltransferase [Candidatus Cloacimonadota bacterium]